MRWRTTNNRRRARARRAEARSSGFMETMGFKLYPYQRELIAWLDLDMTPPEPVSFTLPADFQDELAAIMNVPVRFLFDRPINPDNYRKD